jgi:hypothetical protein
MEELRRQSPPFLPDIDAMVGPAEAPFMAYSTCSTRDFYHPEFVRLSRLAGHEPFYHRKLWEWIFVLHHAFDKWCGWRRDGRPWLWCRDRELTRRICSGRGCE